MSLVIAQELLDFESSLNGKIDGLSSSVTNITNGLTGLSNATTTASNGFSQNYKSSNKSKIINSLTSLIDVCNKINTSVSNDLSNMINEASSILTKINKLKDYKKAVDDANSAIDIENRKAEPNNVEISSKRSIVYSNTNAFNTLHAEVVSQLAKLKSMDADLSFVKDFTKTSVEQLKDNLKFGTFELRRFKASNGTVVQYYIYIPDYGKEVEGLPINMYMHGSGIGENSASRLTASGLGKYIKEKKVSPTGIVILPLAPTGRTYESKTFRDALAELPLSVADKYKADKTRISLSGHSWGAIEAYRLVNEHPGEFSAIVPISGSNKVTSAFNGVSVWAFHGTTDTKTANTSYAQATDKMKEIKQQGGTAVMHAYNGGTHGYADSKGKKNIIEETFTNEYEIDGEKINPLEWAFQQTTA